MRPQDLLPALPIAEAADNAGDAEDPHLAGVAAQTRYLERCIASGQEPGASEFDDAYWSAVRAATPWGRL